MLNTSNSGTPNTRKYISKLDCDQEAWLKQTITKAIITGIELKKCHVDCIVFDSTVEGLVNGTALRIVDILNIEPEYTNLTKI